MKVGLDVDGVLADFQGGWVRTYNEWWGTQVDVAEAVRWDSLVELTHFEEEQGFFAWLARVPNFWYGLGLIPGAAAGVMSLLDAGDEVVLITSRPDSARSLTYDWVRNWWPHGPGGLRRPMPDIHHTRNKSLIDCQVYVDDSPEVIGSLRQQGRPIIRFEQPWNRRIKATSVVTGWAELVGLLDEMRRSLS